MALQVLVETEHDVGSREAETTLQQPPIWVILLQRSLPVCLAALDRLRPTFWSAGAVKEGVPVDAADDCASSGLVSRGAPTRFAAALPFGRPFAPGAASGVSCNQHSAR